MKNLLYKEFKLTIHPLFYTVSLLGVLLLIPTWPFFIALTYIFYISISNIFTNAKAQNDIGFTVMLPVRKRDIVKARCMSIIGVELLNLAVAVVFAIIRKRLYSHMNFFLEPNIAFFGIAFIMYAIFNGIFFPMFYKTGYKIGIPVIVATIAALVFATGVELAVQFMPSINLALDSLNKNMLIWKLLTLAIGIIIFIVSSIITYKISAKRFEKLDL